jgi:hypothetical protein
MELIFLCWLALSNPEPQKVQINPQDNFPTIDLKDQVIILRHQYKHKPKDNHEKTN